jgi:hypothetical protein
MWTRIFWRDTLERLGKTFVQATLAVMLPALMIDGASWSDIPKAASIGAFAGLLSVGMSVLSRLRGDPSSASALKPLEE